MRELAFLLWEHKRVFNSLENCVCVEETVWSRECNYLRVKQCRRRNRPFAFVKIIPGVWRLFLRTQTADFFSYTYVTTGGKPAHALHLTSNTCTPLSTTADSSTHATLSILTALSKHTAPQFRGNLEQKPTSRLN